MMGTAPLSRIFGGWERETSGRDKCQLHFSIKASLAGVEGAFSAIFSCYEDFFFENLIDKMNI